MLKKIVLYFLFCAPFLWAQGNFSRYQYYFSPANIELNPAFYPQAQYYFNTIGLSVLPYIHVVSSGNLLVTNKYSSPFLNTQAYNTSLVSVFIQLASDIFQFGFRVGEQHYLRYHVGFRSPFVFAFEREAYTQIFQGTLNGTVQLMDMFFSGYAYFQHLLGYTFVQKNYSLGINFKYINLFAGFNVNNVNTPFSNNQETGDIMVTGSAQAIALYPQKPWTGSMLLYSGNSGFALDVGFCVQLYPALTLSVSATDLGFSYLNSNKIRQYKMRGEASISAYEPTSPTDIGQLQQFIDRVQHYVNAFSHQFEFSDTQGSYKQLSALPIQTYLGVNYLIKGQHDVHLMSNFSAIPQEKRWRFYYDVGVGYAWRFPIVQPLINYHINSYSFVNLGAGLLFNIKAFEIFLLSDNVLFTGGNVHIQFGTQWYFNRATVASHRYQHPSAVAK